MTVQVLVLQNVLPRKNTNIAIGPQMMPLKSNVLLPKLYQNIELCLIEETTNGSVAQSLQLFARYLMVPILGVSVSTPGMPALDDFFHRPWEMPLEVELGRQ